MLLRAQYIIPLAGREPFSDGAVLVRDGRIADIDLAADMLKRYPDEPVTDYGCAALLPGFVSTHLRLEDYVMRGFIHDVPYMQWVREMNRHGDLMTKSDWYDSSIAGCLEAAACGITCVADTTASGSSCNAIMQAGMRGVVFREVAAMDKQRIDSAMRAAESDISDWYGFIDESRIAVGVAPASMYVCHPAVFARVAEFATANGFPVSLHMSGSREVYNFVKYGSSPFSVHGMGDRHGFVETPPWLPTGVSPVRYALNWDAFDAPNVIARHCVFVDDEDLRILKAYDVAVSACPRFNAQLGMGVAPFEEFRRMGLRFGLGNDSPAATDSLDLFEEMRLAMMLMRALMPNDFASSHDMLRLVTLDAAEVLGLAGRIGSLETGKCADIIAVGMKGLKGMPAAEPESFVVNNCTGKDVLMTMVDGRVVYENGEHTAAVDTERVRENMKAVRAKMAMIRH